MLERLQFVRGSKEDFSAMLHASNKSNQWVRKFRDYDCYEKILGTEKLHDTVAKTKCKTLLQFLVSIVIAKIWLVQVDIEDDYECRKYVKIQNIAICKAFVALIEMNLQLPNCWNLAGNVVWCELFQV